MNLPRIASRIFNAPLLYDEGKAVAFLAGLGGRIVDGGVEIVGGMPAVDHVAFENGRPSMGKVGDRLGRVLDARGIVPFDMVGSVAVIGVEGTLVHKGGWLGSNSGETSYQGLQAQVTRAQRSEAVKGVVFEIDSFGGEAAGAFQTADMIAKLSAQKPTLAILTDNALSAGYLLAAPARQLVLPAEGRTGSIGVLRMLIDARGKLEKEGLKVTMITSENTRPTAVPRLAPVRNCSTACRPRRTKCDLSLPMRSAAIAASDLPARKLWQPRRSISAPRISFASAWPMRSATVTKRSPSSSTRSTARDNRS